MLLRRRLVCYYCGQRSGVSTTGTRKFRCDKCLAVNFLDEGGEIADVPPEEVASREHDDRDTGDNLFVPPEDSIFCSTCLKNQYFYTRALSQYLPEPDDPRYGECEANLPAFQKRLDETYPQCCPLCEPKAKAQLQHATNVARSDHLRRMLDRSRNRRVAHFLGWKRLLVSAAGLGYFSSLAIQMLWHVAGALAASSGKVAIQSLTERFPVINHPDTLEQFMGHSMSLGLICLWWNPRWQHKLQGREGRLVGLDTYYKVQVGILVLRCILWMVLTDLESLAAARPAMHCIAMVLISLISVMSVTNIVKVDMTPLVDWQQDPTALLSVGQSGALQQQYFPTPGDSQTGMSQAGSLNLRDLSAPTRPDYTPWSPPTPPEDRDTMDWAPSQGFQPQPKAQRFRAAKTPFYGTLPAVPHSGVKLPNQTSHQPPKAIGIPPGFFDKSGSTELSLPKNKPPAMAEPKFFVDNMDTGLEKIFGKVFSLEDDRPSTTVTPHKPQQPIPSKSDETAVPPQGPSMDNASFFRTMLAGTTVVVTSGGLLLWTFQTTFSTIDYKVDLFLLYFAGMVSALQLFALGLSKDAKHHPMRLACLGIQTLGLIPPTVYRASTNPPIALIWSKYIAGSLSAVLLQSLWQVLQGSDHSQVDPGPHTQGNEKPQYILPPSHPLSLEVDMDDTPGDLSRRDSNDSVETTTSIFTTSTAPGWKTPRAERTALDFSANNSDRTWLDFGRMGLNDRGLSSGFGSGNAVTRARRGYGKQNQA